MQETQTRPTSGMSKTPTKTWRRRAISAGFQTLQFIEKIIGKASIIGDRPFYESTIFPWTSELEASSEKIRSEASNLLRNRSLLPNFQEISTDQKAITQDNRWKTHFLYGYGVKMDYSCSLCPVTTQTIESIPGMKTAFFSILAPGKHIPSHRGPYKGVVRYHLGLIIPKEAKQCKIRVHNDYRFWQEGKSLIFDDTYQHEVWNDTNEERVVLFLDIERPLYWPLSWINKFLLWAISKSPFVQDAKKNQLRWEENFAHQQASTSANNSRKVPESSPVVREECNNSTEKPRNSYSTVRS